MKKVEERGATGGEIVSDRSGKSAALFGDGFRNGGAHGDRHVLLAWRSTRARLIRI
jgi:hypothetical protein